MCNIFSCMANIAIFSRRKNEIDYVLKNVLVEEKKTKKPE